MTAWTLRPATPEDVQHIARHRYPGESGEHLEEYAAWLTGAFSMYSGVLAEQQGRVIGGAGLLRLNWGPRRGEPHPLRGRVVNVMVEVPFRRRGLARQLVSGVLETARLEGLSIVGLGTSEQARGLYAELGFQASATEMTLHLNS
ncbi:GNAT family N-acetyltransferase [Deinococcus sp. KNUC1210]|uniref:GNAT family N-acetyltransferase n=1 Tax=Deinococcus sp. KNUC1210 TaxID=2917691 RepID=UPI001EF0C33A|nr:GNAT family N-acetyltransferase [Deinococcus sp. KNUC1210]ULH16055.1 GNAT family N-acetyltransferase [Deinococcus sp. KNUC1210]